MIDAALQEQADRRVNYVRLAFAAYWEARKHRDIGDSMSMAIETIRPVIRDDILEEAALVADKHNAGIGGAIRALKNR